MNHRRPHHRRAFTLLELVLVMAVLCIVMGLAAPSLSGFGRARRAGECASQIASLARWARTQAITQGVVYRLNINSEGGTYWLTMQLPDGTFGELGEEFGDTFEVPEDVTIDWDGPEREDGSYVEFYPTGRTEAAVGSTGGTTGGSTGGMTGTSRTASATGVNTAFTRPAVIRLTDANGLTTEIACLSATELFRVLPAGNSANGGSP